MPFLYEKIDTLREVGVSKELPQYIQDNLNPNFELRPYQTVAFENFIIYFESNKLCQKPTQTLFHMATGSGKTLIMAGLMLYLYKHGYRNFLFFVNLSNIVQKTKENFLNTISSKYLFADEITIDGEKIKIKEVSNFQYSDNTAINICFTTTQGLHSDMWGVKENSLSVDDFANQKVVLISDEAHHLNADTKKMSKDEEANYKSWEYTVHRIFGANRDNVLLEFTATCDIKNPLIKAEYENKIVFDYPLYKFRADRYSKEIKTLRSDLDVEDRALQVLILSQYRYKVFQDYRQNIKPVVFFQSRLVKENAANMAKIIDMVKSLSGERIKNLFEQSTSKTLAEAHKYFVKNGISYDELASELKDDFSEEHCISANGNQDVENKQIMLNSLEDKTNPYRAVFAVDKLNEGWDVLNLFDIVRLYETRDGKNGIPGKTTMKEAQLIGRGARYCPFKVTEKQERYQRKYDNDIDNPLRICEELYYHCWNEPRYISELHTALREIGIDLDKTVTRNYVLKEEFKKDDIYKSGYVFVNERLLKSRNEVVGLLPSVRDKIFNISIATGRSGEDVIMDDNSSQDSSPNTYTYRTTIGDIADINYAIVYKALCKYSVFKFNVLKFYFPNLKSTKEFVYDKNYLGYIQLHITSKYETLSTDILYSACVKVLGKIAESISGIEETYEGSSEFTTKYIHDIFKDKRCSYIDPHDGGLGISQNDNSVPIAWKMDLSKEDWFVFEDNYGTSEEKAFVAYFKEYVKELKDKYDKVYLVRNERQLAIYSFDSGERFEPDYLLFLHLPKKDGYEQLQIFIEPKGTHLVDKDSWKENFLLQLEAKAIPVTKFADDNKYKIWGFHFFNRDVRMNEFSNDMNKL
ncbi:DEAD/DEAH box helicase family protein [Faecalimonas mobilis]